MDAVTLNTQLPYTFGNEIEYLQQLATEMHEVVMLGVGPAVMALALFEGNPNIHFSGIDCCELSGKAHVEAAGYKMDFIEGFTEHYAWLWDDATIDLLIVDADHSYINVKKDINQWWPKVKLGGVVFFHDYLVHENDAPGNGVKRAVDEIAHYKYKLLDTPGISFVIRKLL